MNQFLQMLKQDHQEVKGILAQLKAAKDDSSKRQQLFQKLQQELIPHMKAEERTFYPSLLAKGAREDTMEGIEEHHVSEIVLKELQAMQGGGDGQWGAKLAVFKELVEHHIMDEESKIFASAEKVFKPEEMEEIMRKFDQEKQTIKKTFS